MTIPTELRRRLEIKPGHSHHLVRRERPAYAGPDDRAADNRNQGISQTQTRRALPAFEESFKERALARRREDLKFARYDRGFEKKMAQAGKLMKRYRNTLNALAK